MPKKGFDIIGDISALNAHKAAVKRGMAREAQIAATSAREKVRQDAPIDTLGLVESVYIASRKPNGQLASDYGAALADAKARNPDVERRDQAEPPIDAPPARDDSAWAGVGIAVSYADPIIEGYHNVRGDKAMPPNDFFNPNIAEVDANYRKDSNLMLQEEVQKLNRRK